MIIIITIIVISFSYYLISYKISQDFITQQYIILKNTSCSFIIIEFEEIEFMSQENKEFAENKLLNCIIERDGEIYLNDSH